MINNPVEILATGKWDRLLRTTLPPDSVDLVLKKQRRGESTEPSIFDFVCTSVTVPPTVGAVYVNVAIPSFIIVSSTLVSGSTYTVRATSVGAPSAATGSLVKSSGTGDATLTFTSYSEPQPLACTIWAPIDDSGRYWARTRVGSFNGATEIQSCARILRSTWSELYHRIDQIPANTGSGETVNKDSGAQAQSSSQIIEANAGSGRSESGSGWATFTGGAQVPVTRYVVAASGSNSVAYTITGVSRIHWRFYNTSNAGKITVTVTESGVEVSSAQYLVGPQSGSRYINQQYIVSAFDSTRFGHAPLAKGLDPTKTYVATMTWASGLGARIYDSGLIGFVDSTNDRDGFPYNQTGVFGLWDRYASYDNVQASLYAGSRTVYQTADCTQINWNLVRRVNGCFAGVKIYDSTGAEIDTAKYRNLTVHANGDRYIDQYAASTARATVMIADELPAGQYYVHLWALPDRSVAFTETLGGAWASTQWAIYDAGLSTYNKNTAGVPGTDAFIDSVEQFIGGGSDPGDEAGNLSFAGQVRDSGDPSINSISQSAYVSGVHGCETYPSGLAVSVDGTPVSWAAAAEGSQWLGKEIVISFTTQLGTQQNPSTFWANCSYEYRFSRNGIKSTFSITTTREIYRGLFYAGMMIAPNSTATNGTDLGSGFESLYLEPNITETVTSSAGGTSSATTRTHRGACFYTDEGHAVLIEQENPGEIWSEYTGAENATLVAERLRSSKTYAVVKNDSTGGAAGTALAPGYAKTWVSNLRMIYEPGIAAILSA